MSDEGRMNVKSDALGRVVRSAAGRDKKRPFVIVAVNGDGTASIADGALRRLAKPTRKNLAHLVITDARIALDGLDDAAIREFLRSYEAHEAR